VDRRLAVAARLALLTALRLWLLRTIIELPNKDTPGRDRVLGFAWIRRVGGMRYSATGKGT
jgi:hypothetical protein